MPWKECKPMDERLRFIARLLEGEKMAPLCLPGTIFLIAALFTIYMHKMSSSSARTALSKSAKTALQASMALILALPMVQVFINSGGGAAGFDRMPIVLADGVADLAGSA